MSPEQQTQLVDVVRRQGGTSQALSIAAEVGWDLDAASLSYPMLSMPAVCERLGLNAEQKTKLQAVLDEAMAKTRKARQESVVPEGRGDDKQKVDAILTPEQLKALGQIDLRRRVVLAMGYPEKRKLIGITDQQRAAMEHIESETHDRLYHIDREMLAKALKYSDARSAGPTAHKSDE